MRWSIYHVTPNHRLVPLGRVNAPDHTTALVRAAEMWPAACDFTKKHIGIEARKWLNDPHPLGKRHNPRPFTLDDDEDLARKAAQAFIALNGGANV